MFKRQTRSEVHSQHDKYSDGFFDTFRGASLT
jgi:hypothetical protein